MDGSKAICVPLITYICLSTRLGHGFKSPGDKDTAGPLRSWRTSERSGNI